MVNADVRARVRHRSDALPWLAGEAPGVRWKLFEHDGQRQGRITALMQWPPGARIEEHAHELGEETLVISGSFADDFGDYPEGSYLRCPPGSDHAPVTREGCTLLIKHRQMSAEDNDRVVVDTRHARWVASVRDGVSVMPLHRHGLESVSLIKMAPGARYYGHRHVGGEETFVISGSFRDDFGHHPQGTWLRYPGMSAHAPESDEGCVLYVKSGHLSMPQRSFWPLRRTV
jgi:anti-sigma factor ChrR (cupin superfamily)